MDKQRIEKINCRDVLNNVLQNGIAGISLVTSVSQSSAGQAASPHHVAGKSSAFTATFSECFSQRTCTFIKTPLRTCMIVIILRGLTFVFGVWLAEVGLDIATQDLEACSWVIFYSVSFETVHFSISECFELYCLITLNYILWESLLRSVKMLIVKMVHNVVKRDGVGNVHQQNSIGLTTHRVHHTPSPSFITNTLHHHPFVFYNQESS